MGLGSTSALAHQQPAAPRCLRPHPMAATADGNYEDGFLMRLGRASPLVRNAVHLVSACCLSPCRRAEPNIIGITELQDESLRWLVMVVFVC